MKYFFLAAALVATLVLPAPAQASSMLGMINASRGTPLDSHGALASAAAAHSAHMAAEGRVFHSSNLAGITDDWEAMGENVGVGTDMAQVYEAFMASGPHRANILGDYTHAGVGTHTDDEGLVWVAVIFMKASGSATSGDTGASTETAPTISVPTATVPEDPSPAHTLAPRRNIPTLADDEPRFGNHGLLPIAI
jgi:hypothetical protein